MFLQLGVRNEIENFKFTLTGAVKDDMYGYLMLKNHNALIQLEEVDGSFIPLYSREKTHINFPENEPVWVIFFGVEKDGLLPYAEVEIRSKKVGNRHEIKIEEIPDKDWYFIDDAKSHRE